MFCLRQPQFLPVLHRLVRATTQRDHAGEIEWEYQAQGGAAGLGAPQSGVLSIAQNGGGHARAFDGGSIYWSSATGAKTVRVGPLRDYYFSRNGAAGDMGWPALNQQVVSAPTGAGAAQLFTGGSLYAGPLGTFIVREPLRGGLLRPQRRAGAARVADVGSVVCGGRVHPAVRGRACGVVGEWCVRVVRSGAFGVRCCGWRVGGVGGAGVVADVAVVSRRRVRAGVRERVGLPPAGGSAFFVSGAIRTHYFALGGRGRQAGLSRWRAQQCASATECQQEFQFGWILWTIARMARGWVRRRSTPRMRRLAVRTASSGRAPAGWSSTRSTAVVSPRCSSTVAIFYKPAAGAHAVLGVRPRCLLRARAALAGTFGWPTSDQSCAAGVCTQQFEGGRVVSSASGAFALFDPVRAAFDAAGGVSGAWGVPVSALMSLSYHGGGFGQAFANGSAYHLRGRFCVVRVWCDPHSLLRARRRGRQAGLSRWERSSARVRPNVSRSSSSAGFCGRAPDGARVGAPAIDAAYAALGGPGGSSGRGPAGWSTTRSTAAGSPRCSRTVAIFYKPAAGAHAVSGRPRCRTSRAGGAAGRSGGRRRISRVRRGCAPSSSKAVRSPWRGDSPPSHAVGTGRARYAASEVRWSAGANPARLDLRRGRARCCGVVVRPGPSPMAKYSSVVTPVTRAGSWPVSSKTVRAMSAQVVGFAGAGEVVGAVCGPGVEEVADAGGDVGGEGEAPGLVVDHLRVDAAFGEGGHGADEVVALADHPGGADDVVARARWRRRRRRRLWSARRRRAG